MTLDQALEQSTVSNAMIMTADSIFLAILWIDTKTIEFKSKKIGDMKFVSIDPQFYQSMLENTNWRPVAPSLKITGA